MKKIAMICCCLLILAFSTLLLPAHAEEILSGTCGENLTWTLDDKGTLTISGTGEMDFSNSDGKPWFDRDAWGYLNIVTVVIEEGVTSICRDAFSYCYSIQKVVIPESVTEIGDEAFGEVPHVTYRCTLPGTGWGECSCN